ncbi:lipid-A-disaccharide synthase [Actibacterium atlanticum]|uniref:Lipid-A-disaccharide synthase n=1 Tax=Actibacterium atlanticum TaxID=1461693 RepID=A0A058ZQW5_9RHOB|nr:lipid-A-disaccharide synthase [Actibacterium atlanticum]KCV83562.1 lipid-A-disaccharide synthase [Actibacterium atlanticum]
MKRFFLIAGEPSGDALGGALMAGLRAELGDQVEFMGVGGPLMQAQGLQSLFPMEELSVMGIVEVLPKYNALMRRINQCADMVVAEKPDALITIDAPDFSLRVAKRVKAASDVRTVHYVAPTVWAWRAGRARKMAPIIDHVLALFPFEPPYMEAEGMQCDFVGHPVAAVEQPSDADIAQLRSELGFPPESKILLVLPGSRKAEVGRLAPIFGEALKPVLARHPSLRVLVPAAPSVIDAVKAAAATWPGAPVVLDPSGLTADQAEARKRTAFAAGSVALAASGTVSLELAAAGVPMVVAYDMNWISRKIIESLAKIDTVTLTNIITGEKAVPECIGARCKPDLISGALLELLDDPQARATQVAAAAEAMHLLGKGGDAPGLRAARAVLAGIS